MTGFRPALSRRLERGSQRQPLIVPASERPDPDTAAGDVFQDRQTVDRVNVEVDGSECWAIVKAVDQISNLDPGSLRLRVVSL